MAARLDKLPAEMLESILVHLKVADICSLRLTNRALQRRATSYSFRRRFEKKHIYLTQESLEHFIDVTQPGGLGCLAEDLTLYGLAIDYEELAYTVQKGTITRRELSGFISISHEEPLSVARKHKAQSDLDILTRLQEENQRLYKSGEAVKLLAQAFRNLAANKRTRELPKLSLEVSCLADDPEKRLRPREFADITRIKDIWATAEQIFHITMSALAESELQVRELVLFNGPSDLCSLFRDQLRLLDLPKLNILTSQLTSLSLSLSAREPILRVQGNPDIQPTTEIPDDFIGLGMLLAQCPKLEFLQIHCYSADHAMTQPLDDITVPKFAATKDSHYNPDWELPVLQDLVIAGLVVRENDLFDFLERAKPVRLELECIKVVDGTFYSIFDLCNNLNPKLKSIEFKSLYELEMLWFPGPGPSELEVFTRPSDPLPGKITLTREGDEVKLPICYHFPDSLQIRCATNNLYYRRMARLFGPFTRMFS